MNAVERQCIWTRMSIRDISIHTGAYECSGTTMHMDSYAHPRHLDSYRCIRTRMQKSKHCERASVRKRIKISQANQ